MKIKMLILFFILLLGCNLLSACNSYTDKGNEHIDEQKHSANASFDKDINNKIDIFSNAANGNYLAYDNDFIYCINKIDNKIYKITLDGQNKELLSDVCAERLILYKDKIYFIKIENGKKPKVTDEIYSIDTNGNNLKLVLKSKDILNFNIYNDVIYYNASANEISDSIIPYEIHNLYSFNFTTNENSIIYKDICCNVMSVGIHPIAIHDNYIYFNAFAGIDEDIKFIKYNIDNDLAQILYSISAITDGQNIYFHSAANDEKNEAKLCELKINEEIEKAKDVFLYKDNINVRRIAFNETYFFLMCTNNETIDNQKITIMRITREKNEIIKIAEYDAIETSSFFFGYMFLVNDKLIIYDYNPNNNPIYSIKVMDFDGKNSHEQNQQDISQEKEDITLEQEQKDILLEHANLLSDHIIKCALFSDSIKNKTSRLSDFEISAFVTHSMLYENDTNHPYNNIGQIIEKNHNRYAYYEIVDVKKVVKEFFNIDDWSYTEIAFDNESNKYELCLEGGLGGPFTYTGLTTNITSDSKYIESHFILVNKVVPDEYEYGQYKITYEIVYNDNKYFLRFYSIEPIE